MERDAASGHDAPGPAPGARAPVDRPDLLESLRQIGETGRSGLGAANDAFKAMRTLVSADVSLARSAFGRTLAFTGVAIAFGASAWLLLMAALIVWMGRGLGWPWSLSMLLTALVSLGAAALAGWRAMAYFEHTRMQATRRQLARLGIGELSDYMPDAGSGVSAKQVAAQAPVEKAGGEPVKGDQGVDVTPP